MIVFAEDSSSLPDDRRRQFTADVLLTIGLDKTTQLAARGLTQALRRQRWTRR